MKYCIPKSTMTTKHKWYQVKARNLSTIKRTNSSWTDYHRLVQRKPINKDEWLFLYHKHKKTVDKDGKQISCVLYGHYDLITIYSLKQRYKYVIP